MLVDLVEDNGLAEAFGDLAGLGLVGFLEVDREVEHLASVADRESDVLVHGALLLVDLFDDRGDLGHERIHTAVVHLVHMFAELVGDLLFLGLLVELGIETEVNGKLGHHRLLEILVRHALGGLGDDGGGIGHHVHDVDLDTLSGDGIAAA